MKFRLSLKEMKHVVAMKNFFERILINHSNNGSRAGHLNREMTDAFKNIKIFMAVSILGFAAFSLYPIHVFVNKNRQLVPIMRIEFPLLDQANKTNDYLIGQAIILLFGFLGVAGSIAFDVLTLILLLQYRSLVTLLKDDLADYHKLWKQRETVSEQWRECFLKNICLKYDDINSYIRYYEEVFGRNNCQSICILYASLICAVYAVFNNGWMSGYGFCLMCFTQLYMQCIVGTYISIQNVEMNQNFYFIPWYEYPVKVQKTILSLLHASAFNAKELRIGLLAPLNVATGLQMTKSIYSYYTAITNLS